MNKILIIAGPNGAGKTTFAEEFLPHEADCPEFAIRRVERRVRFGGHDIPAATIRRRFQRGLENLRNHDLGIVDEWSIYDASANPPILLDSGDNRPTDKLMEDPVEYRATSTHPRPVRPLDDPDFIGAEAALKRASAKAVARDLAAGLEPIVRTPPLFLKTENWKLANFHP